MFCFFIRRVSHDIEKYEATLLILVGFGGFSILLGMLYNFIRKYVFDDANNLDTTFDAGGKVSMSLTAVTVASQLLWPGDLLQSATVAIKVTREGSNLSLSVLKLL